MINLKRNVQLRENKVKFLTEGNKVKVMKGNRLLESVQLENGDNIVEVVETLKKDHGLLEGYALSDKELGGLGIYIADNFVELLRKVRAGVPDNKVSRSSKGISYTELVGAIADHYNLPKSSVLAISYQEREGYSSEDGEKYYFKVLLNTNPNTANDFTTRTVDYYDPTTDIISVVIH